MKRAILAILIVLCGILISASPLLGKEKPETNVSVLDPDSFVVVQSRGPDSSSVLLYKVADGKLYLEDALVVDGNFTDISRPTVRVLRPVYK